jgi:acyl-[acyl-carrier-protein]-phospholipid O-acyltransferase/long-chain-fatty-acid--[acyl-carrier-protein] ligase
MLDLNEPMLAVASVPDPQKGERLVVLHTLSDDQLARLLEKLDQSDLPNLWRPRPNAFHRIDALPVLGTGKMDIRGVKKMAMDMEQ